MKKFLLGLAGLFALAAPASAADMPVPYAKSPQSMIAAVYDWTGFYIGANGGWGSSRKCWDRTTPAGVFIAAEGCHNATGGVAGAQIGYRAQIGAFVFGAEGQGDWANLRGQSVSLIAPAVSDQSRMQGFGLITGQVGVAFNNVLFYVKGGGAVTADRFTVRAVGTNAQVTNTEDGTRWGGVVGAGLEYGIDLNWSAAIEYDHLFMGNHMITFTNNGVAGGNGPANTPTDRIRQNVDMVTVRVNYRWGGPVIAKY